MKEAVAFLSHIYYLLTATFDRARIVGRDALRLVRVSSLAADRPPGSFSKPL